MRTQFARVCADQRLDGLPRDGAPLGERTKADGVGALGLLYPFVGKLEKIPGSPFVDGVLRFVAHKIHGHAPRGVLRIDFKPAGVDGEGIKLVRRPFAPVGRGRCG